jgi:hypothetical protein
MWLVPCLWLQATTGATSLGGRIRESLRRGTVTTHQPTKTYMARRTQEGMSKPEIIRCLKRYVAREIYRELVPRAALAAAT